MAYGTHEERSGLNVATVAEREFEITRARYQLWVRFRNDFIGSSYLPDDSCYCVQDYDDGEWITVMRGLFYSNAFDHAANMIVDSGSIVRVYREK